MTLLALRNASDYTFLMKLWVSRLLIGIVFFFNVECAFAFIIRPDLYTWNFELAGETGLGMIRGMGVLFLMWNVPYAVALWHPVRFRVSLYEAVSMQAIGVVGEILILWLLHGDHPAVRSTLLRFIFFDFGGLLALLGAVWVTHWKRS